MSISGLHITLFAAIALFVFKHLLSLRLLSSFFMRVGLRVQACAWLLAALSALAYSLISGWGIPAQRTCFMLLIAAWAMIMGRAQSMAKVLSVAAALVTVSDPWAPMAAGFWLSFGAVAALVWAGSRQAFQAKRNLAAWWSQAWRTQWAASLAMLPLGALFFGSLSIVGPLANAIAIPFVSALLTPYLLFCGLTGLLSVQVAAWLLTPALISTSWLLALLDYMATWPWASVAIAKPGFLALFAGLIACLALLLCLRLPRRWSFAVLLLPTLFSPSIGPDKGSLWLSFFDVGQGMAVLIETHERRLLYDTGPGYGGDSDAAERVILPVLRSRGISKIDALIVSHQDKDHAGGTNSVLKGLRPAWWSSSVNHWEQRQGHLPCKEGDEWRWGEVRFRFLHPGPSNTTAVKSSSNARSCVLMIEHPAVKILLPGDLEKAQEKRLLTDYPPEELKADVLLAPHHGSNSASSASFLKVVAPKWAVVQASYRNRFRHPHDKVLERYEQVGAHMLRTDHHGAIQFKFDLGQEPRLVSERTSNAPYWRLQAEPDSIAASLKQSKKESKHED